MFFIKKLREGPKALTNVILNDFKITVMKGEPDWVSDFLDNEGLVAFEHAIVAFDVLPVYF